MELTPTRNQTAKKPSLWVEINKETGKIETIFCFSFLVMMKLQAKEPKITKR